MNLFKQVSTIKPIKKHKENTIRYKLHLASQQSLGISADYAKLVKLPKGENKDEWIAVHTIDFYNIVNRLFSCIQKCNKDTCPIMSCGKDFTYLWKDESKKEFKTAKELPADTYILLSLEKIGSFVDTFPSDVNTPYPKDYSKNVKKMFKWMFRIYAHMMKNHWKEIEANGIEAHINSNFKHFVYFAVNFDLVPAKEMDPMKEWMKSNTDLL
eukprot:gene3091-5261_t